jgi:glycolate oxidase iron-sulfur subunit
MGKKREKDVTEDFLLCNRCGACRYVCPLLGVYREEWAGARGKVELAEAFFRGERIDDKELQKIFDLCLHCMTCEENCPSGMRADEVVMAVRAEMARRGLMPRVKRAALWALGGADGTLFKIARALGLTRKAPIHGIASGGPLSFLYPLLGWPRERLIPLPAERAFLGSGPEVYRAAEVGFELAGASAMGSEGAFDREKAATLIELVLSARKRNLAAGKRAYFFVGHAVNHFFPEEARAVTRLLNILGIDVLAPKNQVCCGAPIYYAGDIAGARKAAARVLESLEGREYDWIVTTCSSGGLMLRQELPRLFDLTYDGYFEISYDRETETFHRNPTLNPVRKEYPEAENLYRQYVEGRVRDVNELVAELFGLREELEDMSNIFRGVDRDDRTVEEVDHTRGRLGLDTASAGSGDDLRLVTYHAPCHLNRGQGVGWQPEAILKMLPGHRYARMKDHDRCCGGGGAFTFLHSEASATVASIKAKAIAEISPDVVATACPLCRIQLMDVINRHFVIDAKGRGAKPQRIPVTTPAELLLEDLQGVMEAVRGAGEPRNA